MCSVSAVSQYYQQDYQNRHNQLNPYQGPMPMAGLGGYIPPQSVVHTFDTETKEMLRQVLKLLDKIDKRLGDVECLDDEKAAFMKSLDLDPSNIGG